MIDQIFNKRVKKHSQHINIVPILDMLTTIIFFLLMSTSFIEYTKVTVPPSSTVSISSANKVPPLTPKMFLSKKEGVFEIHLKWGGAQPGEKTAKFEALSPDDARVRIVAESKRLAEDFAVKFPAQKSIQLASTREIKYQNMISLMDGVREKIPDLILISYNEAEARLAGH